MSRYFAPSGPFVSASTGVIAPVVASNQVEGLFRIFNAGGSLTFAAIVSAAGTAGEANWAPIAPLADFYIAFGAFQNRVIVTNSTCMINPGYALR